MDLPLYLKNRMANRQLSHAYLVVGENRRELAQTLAAAWVCTGDKPPCGQCSGCRKAAAGIHPDIIRADPDGDGLKAEAVRALRSDAYIRPNEAPKKVYVLEHAELLNATGQNILLKLIEEGPEYACFLFLSPNPELLLETIRSRCVMLKYDDGAEAPLRPDAVELCRAFAAGRLLPVTAFLVGLDAKKPVPKREEVSAMLRDCWRTAAEALLLRRGKPRPEPSCAEEARRLADRLTDRQLTGLESVLRQYAGECDYNVGVGHVLGGLAAKWEELL